MNEFYDVQVLDSIGVDLNAQLKSAPQSKLPARASPAKAEGSQTDDELVARLAALR